MPGSERQGCVAAKPQHDAAFLNGDVRGATSFDGDREGGANVLELAVGQEDEKAAGGASVVDADGEGAVLQRDFLELRVREARPSRDAVGADPDRIHRRGVRLDGDRRMVRPQQWDEDAE